MIADMNSRIKSFVALTVFLGAFCVSSVAQSSKSIKFEIDAKSVTLPCPPGCTNREPKVGSAREVVFRVLNLPEGMDAKVDVTSGQIDSSGDEGVWKLEKPGKHTISLKVWDGDTLVTTFNEPLEIKRGRCDCDSTCKRFRIFTQRDEIYPGEVFELFLLHLNAKGWFKLDQGLDVEWTVKNGILVEEVSNDHIRITTSSEQGNDKSVEVFAHVTHFNSPVCTWRFREQLPIGDRDNPMYGAEYENEN